MKRLVLSRLCGLSTGGARPAAIRPTGPETTVSVRCIRDSSARSRPASLVDDRPRDNLVFSFGRIPAMAKIDKVLVGESLVGDGNEVAHIDLIIGPRGSAAEAAFCNSLTNNKDGFTSLLAVIAPNLPCKPSTVMFNKVTIKDARQAVQMFGPAQTGVARAVMDCVEDGTIPANEADDVFICVGVFIHW